MSIYIVSKRKNALPPPEGVTVIDIDRPSGSALGNPFFMKNEAQRDWAINNFKTWFYQKIREQDPLVLNEIKRIEKIILEEKHIALRCWCSPKPCHGDVIREYILEQLLSNDIKPEEGKKKISFKLNKK